MREIKFRCWNKEKKQIETVKEIVFRGMDRGFWTINGNNPDIYELMQLTGLKDKNGKEIYEGDIVNLSAGYDGMENNYQVVWGGSYPAFNLHFLDGKEPEWEYNPFSSDPELEIIGNIYENPEMLK